MYAFGEDANLRRTGCGLVTLPAGMGHSYKALQWAMASAYDDAPTLLLMLCAAPVRAPSLAKLKLHPLVHDLAGISARQLQLTVPHGFAQFMQCSWP